jgi:NADPH-dependent glutamate synthase beta subunit-like oxidoreductase/dihydroorotate dehydrogenase
MAFLTDAQLRAELGKCESCDTKPCRAGCPADCSPADFIMAARSWDEPSDVRRSAALILGKNPLGGVCGLVCPDTFCMARCSRKALDGAVDIPAVQATIVERAKTLCVMPNFAARPATGRTIAVVGAGPAGLAAAAVLAQHGHSVTVHDRARKPGGMAGLIPGRRLDPRVLATDIAWLTSLGDIRLRLGRPVPAPRALLERGFDAVIVATGRSEPVKLGVPGEKWLVPWTRVLARPRATGLRGRRVAIIGAGAVAVDCADTAIAAGATHVEVFTRKKLAELELTRKERESLFESGVHVSCRVRVTEVLARAGRVTGLRLRKVELPRDAGAYHSSKLRDLPRSDHTRHDFDAVILATGGAAGVALEQHPAVVYAGDLENGPTSVVEAVAAGKNAAASVHARLTGEDTPPLESKRRSRVHLPGRHLMPVALVTDFFGREIASPFLLSAAPATDGYDQMKKAYEAGWAGAVMKTAFDGVPIHIPGAYMFALGERTYANSDNVSGHALDRVCREVTRLRREYPERLTMASTGGPVTGDDDLDARVWQSNTRKLDAAGAMGVEYSLSCPQGGDGSKGDIVSQDPELTAKIVGWVLTASDPSVPKLFKLTGAVTSIKPIARAIKAVLERYPDHRAGITLANSFPTLAFRPAPGRPWDEGVVVGMSGEGVAPISYLTLANAASAGLTVSGNGGAMSWRMAATFLALGARTVQFCTLVMKYGLGIVDELSSGLSYFLAERGLLSVEELIGIAGPRAITPFAELSADKGLPAVEPALCAACGNCTRCGYLAVHLDRSGVPSFDAARCIGCSICVQKCFAGALTMRARTQKERAALDEH